MKLAEPVLLIHVKLKASINFN